MTRKELEKLDTNTLSGLKKAYAEAAYSVDPDVSAKAQEMVHLIRSVINCRNIQDLLSLVDRNTDKQQLHSSYWKIGFSSPNGWNEVRLDNDPKLHAQLLAVLNSEWKRIYGNKKGEFEYV